MHLDKYRIQGLFEPISVVEKSIYIDSVLVPAVHKKKKKNVMIMLQVRLNLLSYIIL